MFPLGATPRRLFYHAPGSITMRVHDAPLVTQRWAHDADAAEEASDEEEPLNKRAARSMEASGVCTPWRTVSELLACVLLFSWVAWLFVHVYSPPCVVASLTKVDHAPVLIFSERTGLAWTVDDQTGTLQMEERRPQGDRLDNPAFVQAQSFQIEWLRDDRYFCLRWLHDLRLVEVSLEDHMLRLGQYGCSNTTQMFKLEKSSIFNLGAQSNINVRDRLHLRAHGDRGPPWQPMGKLETFWTRMRLEPLGAEQGPTHAQRSLSELIAKLENSAKGSPMSP